jgi:hypothetical protein
VSRKVTDEKIKQYVEGYFAEKAGADQRYIESESYQLLNRTDIPAGAYAIEGIEIDEHSNTFVMKIKEEKSDVQSEKATAEEGDMVSENTEKKGVEIKFPSVPSEVIRGELKSNGFRWSKFNKVWYHRATAETLEAAHKIAKMWKAEKKGKAV